MSKQGQQGSSIVSQQGLAKSSSESTNFSESIKEHPSSSAPFGDKKDFFEKLSSKSDDQVQQGSISSDNISSDIGQQGVKEVEGSSSSDLKQSSGSSEFKKETTSDLKESSGSSDVNKESSDVNKESIEKQDEGTSFEQHGLISQQGLNWQGPHESEHLKHGTDWDKSTGLSDTKEERTRAIDQGTDLREMSGPTSDFTESSFDFKDSTETGKQGNKKIDNSSDLKQSSGSSYIKQGTSSDLKESSGSSDWTNNKESIEKQDEGTSFGSDIKWQGPSDESEWNAFGSKTSSSGLKTSGSSDFKGSDVNKSTSSSEVNEKRDSDLIDFGSTETKQDTNSSSGAMDLSGEISNLKIDSSSSLGQTKKQSVETGPFYDEKVHDDRNDTK